MDPISALSLAVNVIAVVDVAVKTGKSLWELYKSTSGFTKQTEEFLQATSRFDKALQALDTAHIQLEAVQGMDTNVAAAAKQCAETVKAIKAICDEFSVDKPSIRRTVKAWRKKSHIEELQRALELSTGQLRTVLAIATRVDIGRMVHLLDTADTKQAQLAAKLNTISAALLKPDENKRMLEIIKDTIELSEESLHAMNHAAILRSLWPTTAGKRFGEISAPVADTFAWVLQEPADFSDTRSDDSFPARWDVASSEEDEEVPPEEDKEALREEGEEASLKRRFIVDWRDWLVSGSGVFHIVGKPGCGKSTLTKYLATHKATHDLLQQWAAADGKQLIVSSFYFWKPGTEEQKSMHGLRRGVLYDIVKIHPGITKLLFPEHWAPERYALPYMAHMTHISAGSAISDDHVRAAFARLVSLEDALGGFRICLFIDGLDEFEGPVEEGLWSFCNQLSNWTASSSGNIKLCVSSREEPPILNALASASRITLHALTRSDIKKLVREKLELNSNYQRLVHNSSAYAGRDFQDSISRNAEGVFLWVVLVIKWVEDELATATSFRALRSLVESAPQELGQFFERILGAIPKHRARGAYFMLAMMMRLRGYCLCGEQKEMPKIFPVLRDVSLIGLSCIFDTFENSRGGDKSQKFSFSTPHLADWQTYSDRESDTVIRLQTFCRGLVEVQKGIPSDHGIKIIKFIHRSVPDFLSEALPGIALKWNLDDNWITEGLLSMSLVESRALFIDSLEEAYDISARLPHLMESIAISTPHFPAPWESRLFTRLEEIDTFWQGLGDQEVARILHQLPVYLHTRHKICTMDVAAPCPVFAVTTCTVAPLVDYVKWKLQDPQTLKSPFNQLLMLAAAAHGTYERHMACRYPDVSPIVEGMLQSGISPNTRYPRMAVENSTKPALLQFTLTEWLNNLDDWQTSPSAKYKSPWRDILSTFLFRIAFSDRRHVPDSIWNELLVWLRFGAEVPADVLVIAISFKLFEAFVGFRYPGEDAEVAYSVLPLADEKYRKVACTDYFRTFKSTTISSMIRWHSPKNMDDLLRYTDPMASLAEDPQEWEPPSYAACSVDENDYSCSDARYNLASFEQAWVFGLCWQSDIHDWTVGPGAGKTTMSKIETAR